MMKRSLHNSCLHGGTRIAGVRAFVLLEIVIALGILILGMTVIGSQFQDSRAAAYDTERFYRAVLLAESKLAELDTGLIQPEEEIEEDFGRLFPDYGWRMRIEPTAVADLNFITLEVLFKVRLDPDEAFDHDDADALYTVHTMRATPTRLDLTRDFGMSEEQADKLDEAFAAVADSDVTARDFDPGVFRDLPLEDLIELLPSLLGAFGLKLGDILPMLPPELQAQFAEALRASAEGEEAAADDDTAPEASGMEETPDVTGPGASEVPDADDGSGLTEEEKRAEEEGATEERRERRPRRGGAGGGSRRGGGR